MPGAAWRTNDHAIAHLQTNTVPKNLRGSDSVQWLLGKSIHKACPIGIPGRAQRDIDHIVARPQLIDHCIYHGLPAEQ